MGEAAGGRVGELARNRRRLEWRQTRPQIGRDGFAIFRRPLRVKGGEQRDGLVDHAPVLKPGQVAAIEVISAADHDFDAATGQIGRASPASASAAVAASRTRNCSGSPPSDGARHDPVLGRIEGERGIEIAAATSGNAIARGRLRVAKSRGVPTVGGDFARAVLASEDVLEIRARVRCAGKAAAEADQWRSRRGVPVS